MHNFSHYPTVDVTYSVKSDICVTPSQPQAEKKAEQLPEALLSLNDQSSAQLISHNEVLEMFHIKSKATIFKWRKNRGFPDPVTLMPLRWLRTAVEEWRDGIGGYGG